MKPIAAAFIILAWFAVSSPQPRDTSLNSATSTAGDRAVHEMPLEPLINPRIVVIKSKRLLRLYSNDSLVRTYRVALGLSPVENKERAGDRRTPEGEFYISVKNSRSQFYLSLGLSYPNREHAERGLRDSLITRSQYNQIIAALARKRTPPQNTRLGGEIFIHGNGSKNDWTWGCVALDDGDIRELFDAVPVGTPVFIEH
ncbi:MAG TPA: L,D-transpeptidase [Blastocatellia bacterium]|nr:L,D-transpeptidase [Blastocatellia bacterium]